MIELEKLAALAGAAARSGECALFARLLEVEGSSYRRPGARMVVTEGGAAAGSISGGCLEADLVRRVPAICAARTPVEIEHDSSAPEDLVWGLGSGCRGRVRALAVPVDERLAHELGQAAALHASGRAARLLLPRPDGTLLEDELRPPPALAVAGGGRDAEPLALGAAALGWSVAVGAPRVAEAVRVRLAREGIPILDLPALARWAARPRCAAVVMTHNFFDDLAVLEAIARLPAGLEYVGVLGPAERTLRLEAAAEKAGIPLPTAPLRSPAGLDVGAETPEEIALAILAEIQAVLANAPAGFLKDRSGAIHAPGGRSISITSQVCLSTRG